MFGEAAIVKNRPFAAIAVSDLLGTKLPFEFVPPSSQAFTGALPVGVLIARIYEVFPVLCPLCGGQMRLIAFITHSADIRQILEHIGADSLPPHISPARVRAKHLDITDPEMLFAGLLKQFIRVRVGVICIALGAWSKSTSLAVFKTNRQRFEWVHH